MRRNDDPPKEVFDDTDYICTVCNGSGEGQYDGTKCYACNGSSVERCQQDSDDFEEPDEPDDYIGED